METLMILTYTAFCYAVFKLFKIPLNKWTVPTAVLGGVIMIGTVILLMNYNHPYTKVARTAVVTTPIVPLVRGRVTEVPVTPNVPLKEGDVLFKMDPTPLKTGYDFRPQTDLKTGLNILKEFLELNKIPKTETLR